MRLKRFTQFVNENTDDAEELAALGFNSKIDTDEIQELMDPQYHPEEKTDTTLGFDLGFDMTADDLGLDPERAEAAELDSMFLVQYYVDFDFETMKAKVQVSVLNSGIDFDGAGNAYEVDFKLASENHDSQGIADELTQILQKIEFEGMFIDLAVDVVNDIIDRRLGEVSEKKKLKWHDSDEPNTKGKFIIENLSDEEAAELRAMGFGGVDTDAIAELVNGATAEDQIVIVSGQFNQSIDDYGIDSSEYPDIERDVWTDFEVRINFIDETVKSSISVAQKDIGLYEDAELEDYEWSDLFQNGDPVSMKSNEIAEDIELFMSAVTGFEDSLGMYDKIQDLLNKAIEEQYHRWDDEEEDEDDEDEISEKKKLKWHDSDAPDAKGRFKELGVNKLADWLIRTRGGNMQKITGSLNQQINFNKRKNPSYAKKMESTREAVKRKLAKRKR
jgi:hypothetical protein